MPESQFERDLDSGVTRINPETGQPYITTSWAAVDLEPFKRGERVIDPPAFLHRSDGRALIYPGRPHVFYGESESLKSWAALLACRSVVDAGYRAVYVDLEGSEPSFVERARMVGIADGHLGRSLHYVRPIGALQGDAAGIDFWHQELDIFEPTLVVLDGVTELYALQGWDISRAEDAARFQATFAFHRGGVASIAIDHTSKGAGRGQIGSQHKRAGLDGAEYEFESVRAAGRGGESVASIRVTKDRHGFIREWTPGAGGIGTIHVGVPDGPDRVVIEPARLADLVDPRSDAQDRVREYLREHPDGSTQADVRRGTGLKTNRVAKGLSELFVLGEARNIGTEMKGCWKLV